MPSRSTARNQDRQHANNASRPRWEDSRYATADRPDTLHQRLVVFFFFQAEDGIRDSSVTGVQTCALPISPAPVSDPGPAVPDETPGSGPATGPGPAKPSKTATDKLTRLLQQIPLGDGAKDRKSVV